jgi:DNA/RNA-binding protein KIN17
MNATHWRTLTSFVHHLADEGICLVEETEKGLFITYIDKDPEALHQAKKLEKLSRIERDEEERQGS